MPTVRLTKKLVNDIRAKVHSVGRKQVSSLPDLPGEVGLSMLKAFVKHYSLGPRDGHYDINDQIDMMHIENVPLTEPDTYGQVYISIPPVSMICPRVLYSEDNTMGLDLICCEDIDFPAKAMQALRIHCEKQYGAERDFEEFMRTIDFLLQKCTTVKQFIEAWPQGEQFIPNVALTKHYEEERKKRKRGVYLEDEQLASLNQTLLTSKLT